MFISRKCSLNIGHAVPACLKVGLVVISTYINSASRRSRKCRYVLLPSLPRALRLAAAEPQMSSWNVTSGFEVIGAQKSIHSPLPKPSTVRTKMSTPRRPTMRARKPPPPLPPLITHWDAVMSTGMKEQQLEFMASMLPLRSNLHSGVGRVWPPPPVPDDGRTRQFSVSDALHIPTARCNLISGSRIDKKGVSTRTGSGKITYLNAADVPFASGGIVRDLYKMDVEAVEPHEFMSE
ncbi:hypothetical protein B0H11DRAFT_2276741 [Mycena galericulata]|nr:hypothetical protein B0H11DRAFT_2276741 [Mycena galericulata]